MLRPCFPAVLLCGLAAGVSAQTTVVPGVFATTGTGVFPYDTLTREFQRSLQQVFAASELAIPAGGVITHITFRSSNFGGNAAGTWPEQDLTWQDYEIYLGRAATTPGSMSTIYANNVV